MTEPGEHTEHGDGRLARAGEILRTVVGSEVHGIAIEDTPTDSGSGSLAGHPDRIQGADHDEMGINIEPPELVIGLRDPMDHYVYRTQPEGARSGPGDTDLVMYSLRRYLRLATKGNPTALLPLFAPVEAILVITPLGEQLRELGPALLSQAAVRRFLGYMTAQLDRMLGRASGAPSRPELVARYGYDTKFASHALRLAYQGLEVVRDGRLTLPMPDAQRQHVRSVKQGDEPDPAVVVAAIETVASEVEDRLSSGRTPLPAEPDWDRVSSWSVRAHRQHWGWAANPPQWTARG
jgi:hypothetical protein